MEGGGRLGGRWTKIKNGIGIIKGGICEEKWEKIQKRVGREEGDWK